MALQKMKILVPLDASRNSARTINALIAMKRHLSCPLTLLHVLDHDRISYRGAPMMNAAMIVERAREAAKQFIEEQRHIFAAAGVQAEAILKEGPSRKTICDLADSGEFDLLIIGRHTEGELKGLLFGQVSNYVIHNVKSPVLVI
jgi:nucleotide-binding universal stress UspA family protein